MLGSGYDIIESGQEHYTYYCNSFKTHISLLKPLTALIIQQS
jgi:hypothetical protein